MKAIAPDEARHAALALAVRAWLDSKLSAKARGAVEREARRATSALLEELRVEPMAVPLLGYPTSERARAMCIQVLSLTAGRDGTPNLGGHLDGERCPGARLR